MGTFPQNFHYPFLWGKILNHNLDVILINAQITSMGEGQSWITAGLAIVGYDLPRESVPLFFGIGVQLTGLDAIGGTPPIKKIFTPTSDFESGEWRAHGNPESKQTWTDHKVQVIHDYYIESRMFDSFDFRVRFAPRVQINSTAPLPLTSWLQDWINPLRELIDASTGRREEITAIWVHGDLVDQNSIERRGQIFGRGISQAPYFSSQREAASAKAAFTLRGNENSLLDLIASWHANSGNPLLQMYSTVIVAKDQHPRSRLLFSIQCLEGLYGYENRATRNSRIRKHNVKKFDFLQHLTVDAKNGGSAITSSDRKFAKESITNGPVSGLDFSLRQLFDQLPDSGYIRTRLERLKIIQDKYSDPGLKNPPIAPEDAIRHIRNDLSHGNCDYPIADVSELADFLGKIVRAHLLRVLGCDRGVQDRALKAEE
ncbi:hypothetical protein P9209_05965 [Prescottella defluvii]|nr:hypothetical protein P9209_05965 [Prescottella defluvii]